jgi:hypothetical protein
MIGSAWMGLPSIQEHPVTQNLIFTQQENLVDAQRVVGQRFSA